MAYNLEEGALELKDSRRSELIEEIEGVLRSEILEPGHAGKLKGKLMFGASQLWGRWDVLSFGQFPRDSTPAFR